MEQKDGRGCWRRHDGRRYRLLRTTRRRRERRTRGKRSRRGDQPTDECKSVAASEDEETVAQLHQFLSTATHIVLTALPQWTDSTSHSYVIDLLAALVDQLPVALPLMLSSLHASISQAANKALTLLRDERPLLMQADGAVVAVERVADGRAAERVKEVVDAVLLMLERVMEGERRERYRGRVKRLIQRILFSHPSLAASHRRHTHILVAARTVHFVCCVVVSTGDGVGAAYAVITGGCTSSRL